MPPPYTIPESFYLSAKEHLSYCQDTGEFRWKTTRYSRVRVGQLAGSLSTGGYHQVMVGGKHLRGGRLAWYFLHGELPECVDHINGDRSDNRGVNLRSATRVQNSRNCKLRSDNKFGHKGIGFVKGKYTACIRVNTKLIWLGRNHTTLEEAVEAREYGEALHFGKFNRGEE